MTTRRRARYVWRMQRAHALAAIGAVLAAGAGLAGACSSSKGPTGSAAGLVRVIEADTPRPTGVEATGRVGDYLLDNGRARFVVQGPDSSTGWGLYGGALVDLDAGPEAAGDERLEELFVQCDLRGFRPTSAEIVQAGDANTPGILRFVGADAGLPFLDALLPREPLDVSITVDYVLPPTGDTLEIVITAKDERKTERRELSCGLVLLPGDAYEAFAPGRGFTSELGGELDLLALTRADAPTGYALHAEAPLEVILAGSAIPFIPVGEPPQPFLANASLTARYFVTVSGAGDVESLLEATGARDPDAARRPVTVALEGAALGLLEDVQLVFDPEARDGTRTAARPRGGAVQVQLAPGTYTVEVQADLRRVERFELEVPAGTEPLARTHEVRALGELTVTTEELDLDGSSLGPTPARLWIIEGPDRPIGTFAPYAVYMQPPHTVWLAPGAYTVAVSRGPEHEIAVRTIEIAAGDAVTFAAQLPRVVDTRGWISGDFHVHGTRSTDSEAPKRDRALGAAAEGLDLLVATDHDAVTDYAPQVAALGLGDRLRTAPGTEMSMLYGHMNGFPVAATAPEDHWRPGWFVYDEGGRFDGVLEPHEVTAALREAGAEVVQLNHPRSSQGVFQYLDLDPATGQVDGEWPAPDAIELLNGKRLREYADVLADFHGLVRAGRRVTGTGTSDVHDALGVGYARTYVPVAGDVAWTERDLGEIWAALRSGRAVAANGPFVTLRARRGDATAGVGETLVGEGPAQLEVQVQAPSWVPLSRLRILQRDQVLVDRPLAAEDADPDRPALRFSGTFTATVTADSYFMLEVSGPEAAPLLETTLSVTNPVWADAEGDGLDFD